MTSNPRPPAAATASSMYPDERWSKTACAPSRRTRAIPRRSPPCRIRAARGPRYLNRRDPHAAARSVDRTVSPGTARARWKRATPGGGARYADRGPLRVRDVSGKRVDPRRVAHRELRVGAGHRLRGVHAVAGGDPRTPSPTASTMPAASFPGCKGARAAGIRPDRMYALHRIHPGGADADQDLPGGRRGVRTSSRSITSGGPNARTRIAFIWISSFDIVTDGIPVRRPATPLAFERRCNGLPCFPGRLRSTLLAGSRETNAEVDP